MLSAAAQGTLLARKRAYINGSCQVPPNDSTHEAVATFEYPLLGSTTLSCSLALPISLAPLVANLHGPARPGETAPVLFNLGSITIVTNVLIVISWPGVTNRFTNVAAMCTNVLELSPEQWSRFNQGLFYVSVTSSNYPAGELRGQVTDLPVLCQPIHKRDRFAFKVTAPPGIRYTVEAASDSGPWVLLTNVMMTLYKSVVEIEDPGAPTNSSRLYRAYYQRSGTGFPLGP